MTKDNEHECDDECYHHNIEREAYRQLHASLRKRTMTEVFICRNCGGKTKEEQKVTITEMDLRFKQRDSDVIVTFWRGHDHVCKVTLPDYLRCEHVPR